MKRFETAAHPVIYWLIAMSMATVFIIDVRTPIGVATWILYLLPILMCFLAPKPWLPLLVALVASGLIVVDWFLSPAGTASEIARFNRGLGFICIWSTALLARFTLATRIQLREQDWMRTARARIADAIVGEQTLARLAQRVLEFLVDYLGAQAGTMYVAETGGYLQPRRRDWHRVPCAAAQRHCHGRRPAGARDHRAKAAAHRRPARLTTCA